MSKQEASRASGVSSTSIQEFEDGITDSLRPHLLFRYLNALWFNPSILIDGVRLIVQASGGDGATISSPGTIDFWELSKIFEQERTDRGWSLGRASYLSGVPRTTIHGYEQGSIATFSGRDYFRYLNTLSMKPTIDTDDGPLLIDDIQGIPWSPSR